MAVTLSVPEILTDIMEAFKVETPELFGPAGFAQDFTSDTAALGDKITAKISHLPVVGDYDKNNGGWRAAAQDVTTLMEDVPVTIDQLRNVTVKIPLLTAYATKGVDLYKAAVANIGIALGKDVVDSVLRQAMVGVSNAFLMDPFLTNLDTFEALRDQCNSQKMHSKGRFAFINTPLAGALGSDDRTKSKLFYGDVQGEEGYRRWENLCGFSWVREYTDMPNGGNVAGLAGDRRLAAVSVRKIRDMSETAKALNIPIMMEFHPARDAQSGLELAGIVWQEQGTGDSFLSVAIMFGVGVGNQGGAVGSKTDHAGCLIRTP